MQITTKRIGALLLAACLLAVLAFGGTMAWAEDSGQGGDNSLTVQLSGTAYNDQTTTIDITASDVKYDLYWIAEGEKDPLYDTWSYDTWKPEFASLKPATAPTTARAWQDIADAAADLVKNSETPIPAVAKDVTGGSAFTGLKDGLFLVIPQKTMSSRYIYTFLPSIVALPTKEPITGAPTEKVPRGEYTIEYPVIRTDGDYGAWKRDATINLKYSIEPAYGTLLINKNIVSIAGTMANWKKTSFHYHIVSTPASDAKGLTYDNWASVTVTGEGDFQAPPVRHIPVGTEVVVTEVYEGAGFTAVGSPVSEPVTIVPDNEDGTWPEDKVAQVYFKNTSNKKIIEGSGIQNEFTWENNDWQLVTTPESGQISKPEPQQ